MRQKNKSKKTTFPSSLFLPGLIFAPGFSTSSPRAAQGDRARGLQSVHPMRSLLLLPPSCSSSAPVWGPSHKATGAARKPAPARAPLHRATASFGLTHLLWHGVLHGLQGAYLLHHGPPWAAGGQPASPWPSPQAAGE